MRKRIVLVLTILSFTSIAQVSDDVVIWGTRDINWDDFRFLPDNKSPHAALLSYSIDMKSRYIRHDSIVLIIYAKMNRNKSWTKTDSMSVLIHERKHFELAEIWARRMRKEFIGKTFLKSTMSVGMKKLYNEIDLKAYEEQKRYDSESQHSKDSEQQFLWNKKIEEELKALEAYANPIVPLKVDWKK